jgi:hypothetical protein
VENAPIPNGKPKTTHTTVTTAQAAFTTTTTPVTAVIRAILINSSDSKVVVTGKQTKALKFFRAMALSVNLGCANPNGCCLHSAMDGSRFLVNGIINGNANATLSLISVSLESSDMETAVIDQSREFICLAS